MTGTKDDHAVAPSTVARTTPELERALGSHDVVDLTALIAEDLPCWWPVHMQFQHKTFNWFRHRASPAGEVTDRLGPYQTRWMLIDEHTGTHLDAPMHFIPPPGSGLDHAGPAGTISVDRVDVRQTMGPAAVVDVPEGLTAAPGTSPVVGPQVLLDWEERHGPLVPGDIALFRSGWDRFYRPGVTGNDYAFNVMVTKSVPGWPVPAVDTLELLLERGVRCIGADTPSIGAAEDGEPQHVAALEAGAVFVEALVNLGLLPPRGAYFVFLPIRIRDGTGGPGRAIALVER